MELEKFDIEKAKAGRKVVTRSGLSVEILRWDARGDDPIIGLMFYEGQDEPKSWKIDGRYYNTQDSHDWDLMTAPEEMYVIVQKDRKVVSIFFDSKLSAEDYAFQIEDVVEGIYKLTKV